MAMRLAILWLPLAAAERSFCSYRSWFNDTSFCETEERGVSRDACCAGDGLIRCSFFTESTGWWDPCTPFRPSPPSPPYPPLAWHADLSIGTLIAVSVLLSTVPCLLLCLFAAWPWCRVATCVRRARRRPRDRGTLQIEIVDVTPSQLAQDYATEATLDVESTLGDPPGALLGVSVARVSAALARGESATGIMSDLFTGSRWLERATDATGTSKLGRLAIITYRIAKADDGFTLDEAAFRSVMATAQEEAIDFLWLDCWAYRQQMPWKPYDHAHFCASLATVI